MREWGERLKEYQIYLCGGMGKFGKDEFDKGNAWRVYCKNTLEQFEGTTYNVKVINPNDYFNFKDEPPRYTSEREVMELYLDKLRHSDLVSINVNDMYSLGSACEMAIAYEKRIPIIGLDIDRQVVHPVQ